MPQVSFQRWQEFIAQQPNPHILQSAEWGELKRAFGWELARILSGGSGIQLLFRKLPLGLSVAYAAKPVFSDQPAADLAPLWAEVDALCRKKHAVFLKVEPDGWDSSAFSLPPSFSLSPHNIQPPRTLLVSLAASEEEILGRMKQKCRYNIRLAEKKEVTVRAWNDLDGFHRLMQITGGRDGFGVHTRDYYQKAYDLFHPAGMAEIFVAEYAAQPLAALMVFALGARAYYLYGASGEAERNRMPAYLLQWRAMQWARQRGCSEYDLWGVPDEDEQTLEAGFESRADGLWGVYRFKRGFGGQLRRAAQALDRVYLPPLYWAYLKFIANRE